MNSSQRLVQIVLRAFAVGMAAACIILGYLGGVDLETQLNMLALGLLALAVAGLQKTGQ